MMNLDIETTVRVLFLILLFAGGGILFSAIRAFREANRLRFFLKKREILSRAWRLIFFAVITISGAFLINRFAEPVTYQVFEPSPTVTLTPTITQTYTVTLSPTASLTPTETITPEFTSTPIMPVVISEDFTSVVTPNPEARFSPIEFARRLNGNFQPINPSDRFDQPNATMFGSFSYENMSVGAQWTALWFRDGELLTYETIEWNGASGGYGYADLTLPAEEWGPGIYEVQIFVGEIWETSGSFEVFGEPPTATPTLTSTASPLPTETPVPTETPLSTNTAVPTETARPTLTPTLTNTAEINTATLAPTSTNIPTSTATITQTATITLTPQPTRRSTFFR